jgi:molybdopterin converting factor small subunit
MLRDCAENRSRFEFDAPGTLDQALRALQEKFPLLRAHVWDDAGRLRPHVLIFLNDQGLRWMQSLDVPLKHGDRIHIVQAISGGEDQAAAGKSI